MSAQWVKTVSLAVAGGWLVSVLAGPGIGWPFTGDLTKDPADVIEKYLSLDRRGARLKAATAQVLRPYVAWDGEPSWGRLTVISRYEVIRDSRQWEVLNSQEALIPVVFHVVGSLHIETATFWPEVRVEERRFHIKAVDDRWRIVGPQLPPHVGLQRLIDYVRLLAWQETDESRRVQLKRLQQALESVR
ncbi:MAG: hypothetical protein D6690_03590 [Nitrospirae bacterium]|nr:MAG: hypothetical protein D6690_03590 [Nitrospirota bacterium]